MENYTKILNSTKKYYFNIGNIYCPLLKNNKIIFDEQGFRHFMRKNNKQRPIKDQIRRFILFNKYAVNIVSSKKAALENQIINSENTKFWVITNHNFSNKKQNIKIILRQISNGNIHFYSIMNSKQKSGY
jgi:predicted site-specific integrase-resolvase